MEGLLRSEEMTLCQMFLQSEAAYTCVSELGELGLVQFRDLNPGVNAFQRKFVNEIRRCEEMERKLRFLEKEVRNDGIPMLDTGDNPDAPAPKEMVNLESIFEKLENEMREVNSNTEALKKNFLELTELKHILRKTQTFFDETEHGHHQAMHDQSMSDESSKLLRDEPANVGRPLHLGFVAGVILRERIQAFERMLWRSCRGNVFLRQAVIDCPLEDPATSAQVYKSVLIIFFQGDQLKTRVKKICEGFRATLYPCPETQAERREMSIGVMTRIEDLNTVLSQTQDHRHRVLVAAAKNVKVWSIKVLKIKAIYHALNMFNLDVTQKCLIAECWCPVTDLDRIQYSLRRGTERSGSSVPSILNRMMSNQVPPTYNRTNKLTEGFQNIVDAYGISSYQEVNPAIFTVITFPFLFAVMFGDMGHGLIMLFAALYLVLGEKRIAARRIDNEIFKTFFDGRYIILLMGAFSVYTGFIYNDIFSKSLNLFQSRWYTSPNVYTLALLQEYEKLQLNPNGSYTGTPYPIGLDPVWQVSLNKIAFTNSMKMKLSVILGVTHMFFGISLSFVNYRHFRKRLNMICDFIPSLTFLFCMFGFLVLRIIHKWFNYTSLESTKAPSLLIGAINMFLFNYRDDAPDNPHTYHTPGSLKWFQSFLVIVAAICVPWMMFVKPYYLKHESKFRKFKPQSLSVQSGDLLGVHNQDFDTDDDDARNSALHSSPREEVLCKLQYVGQSNNNRARMNGYKFVFRLYVAELSEVLWTMVLRVGFMFHSVGGVVLLVLVFMFWSTLTVAVLVLMEGLSAFLHALRLHWVEFQSKFYSGAGYKFQPFSFELIIDLFEE